MDNVGLEFDNQVLQDPCAFVVGLLLVQIVSAAGARDFDYQFRRTGEIALAASTSLRPPSSAGIAQVVVRLRLALEIQFQRRTIAAFHAWSESLIPI